MDQSQETEVVAQTSNSEVNDTSIFSTDGVIRSQIDVCQAYYNQNPQSPILNLILFLHQKYKLQISNDPLYSLWLVYTEQRAGNEPDYYLVLTGYREMNRYLSQNNDIEISALWDAVLHHTFAPLNPIQVLNWISTEYLDGRISDWIDGITNLGIDEFMKQNTTPIQVLSHLPSKYPHEVRQLYTQCWEQLTGNNWIDPDPATNIDFDDEQMLEQMFEPQVLAAMGRINTNLTNLKDMNSWIQSADWTKIADSYHSNESDSDDDDEDDDKLFNTITSVSFKAPEDEQESNQIDETDYDSPPEFDFKNPDFGDDQSDDQSDSDLDQTESSDPVEQSEPEVECTGHFCRLKL